MSKIMLYEDVECINDNIKQLRDKLLEIGGTCVKLDGEYFDCNFDKLLDRGISFVFEKCCEEGFIHVNRIELPNGFINQPYLNSTYVWKTSKDEIKSLRIVKGFALYGDGVWRDHCWLLMLDFDKEDKAILKDIGEPPSDSGMILLETTGKLKLGYYGYVLDDNEAEELASFFPTCKDI